MKSKTLGASVIVAVGILGAICFGTHSLLAGDPEEPLETTLFPVVEQAVHLPDWPAPGDISAVYGYEWDQGAYAQLSPFSIAEDETEAHDLYWKNGVGYACFVTRRLRLVYGQAELNLSVTVCRNYDAARNQVLRQWINSNRLPMNVAHGTAHNFQVGEFAILRDVDQSPGSTYIGIESNNVVFVRGNVIVDVVLSDPGSSVGFSAAELCTDMDAEILNQYQACSGSYDVPTASVSLGTANFDLSEPGPRELDTSVAISTSHPTGATVSKRAFVSHYQEAQIYDATKYAFVTDPNGIAVWSPMTGFETKAFDDIHNPTTLTGQRSDEPGDWQVVIAAWGPNLLPVFGTADYTIIR